MVADRLDELFERCATRWPERVAIVLEGESITYASLADQVVTAAKRLHALQVGPEDRVGIALERSVAAVVWILATLRAGAAYVPLDTAYPPARLRYMVADSGARVVVTRRELASLFEEHTQAVFVEEDDTTPAGRMPLAPRAELGPHAAAYVIYTSGSTGQPKGVVGTHAAALNRLAWIQREFSFSPDEVCCLKTSLSFVDSVGEILDPLLSGVPSVIVSDEIAKNGTRLADALARHAVTRLFAVPSLLRALLRTPGDLATMLRHLRFCISSGEALPLDLAASLLARLPACRLLNFYGSTEVADATWDEVTLPLPERLPIGRPIDHARVDVLDDNLLPVPPGSIGEIYVGGAGVARGYHDQPTLTAARFVPATRGERMYRTHDLGRFRDDGVLEYLGRADHQIKIRGLRVELNEIENAILEHPSVRQAIVVVRDLHSGDDHARAMAERLGADTRRLVAYVVPGDGSVPVSELKSFLRARVPEFMVPSIFVEMDVLPLTPNGKFDRQALERKDLE